MINEAILIAVSVISAIATFSLSVRYKQGPVKSSAFLSLIIGLLFYFLPSLPLNLSKTIPLSFIGASFVGMSSSKKIPGNFWIVFAGAIFGFLFVNTSEFFTGYGGGLGAAACLSIVITLGLVGFIRKVKRTR